MIGWGVGRIVERVRGRRWVVEKVGEEVPIQRLRRRVRELLASGFEVRVFGMGAEAEMALPRVRWV